MKQILSLVLSLSIVLAGTPLAAAGAQKPAADDAQSPFARLVARPYLELFEEAPELNISSHAIEAYRQKLEKEKDREKERLERKEDSIKKQIDRAQDELKELGNDPKNDDRRHVLHCRIQELRKQLQETQLAKDKGVEVNYDNKLAKLRVLEEWPERYAKVVKMRGTREAFERKFGDFRDIGFRAGPFENQKDDIDDAQEAIQELKRYGMMPEELDDEAVNTYVRRLAERIARNSDLQVPLRITVLRSKEINAFSLGGGYLYVNTGLIEKAGNESELAGVIAHEIAHSAARHSHRLMKRATIASLIYNAAQVAALIFTGGAVGIGLYYALQYGFYGLGLVISLQLLGVSRDYEIESDILGAQYLWNAGYDPRSFISFFDKMASEKGYITGVSWFRTHPPFYERMADTYEQILLLPKEKQTAIDSLEFQKIHDRVVELMKKQEERDKNAPSLKKHYECEDVKTGASGGGC